MGLSMDGPPCSTSCPSRAMIPKITAPPTTMTPTKTRAFRTAPRTLELPSVSSSTGRYPSHGSRPSLGPAVAAWAKRASSAATPKMTASPTGQIRKSSILAISGHPLDCEQLGQAPCPRQGLQPQAVPESPQPRGLDEASGAHRAQRRDGTRAERGPEGQRDRGEAHDRQADGDERAAPERVQ